MKGSSSALVILCTIMFTRQCMAVQWFSSIEEYFRWQARKFGLQASITTEPSSRTDSQIMTDASWLFNDDQPSTDVETTTSNVATTTEYMEMLPECCMMGKRAGRHGFSCVVDDFSFLSKDRERNRGHNFKYINPYRNIQSQAYNRCLTSGVRALTLEFQRCCKHAYRMRERPSSHLNGLLIEPPIQSNQTGRNRDTGLAENITKFKMVDAEQVSADRQQTEVTPEITNHQVEHALYDELCMMSLL